MPSSSTDLPLTSEPPLSETLKHQRQDFDCTSCRIMGMYLTSNTIPSQPSPLSLLKPHPNNPKVGNLPPLTCSLFFLQQHRLNSLRLPRRIHILLRNEATPRTIGDDNTFGVEVWGVSEKSCRRGDECGLCGVGDVEVGELNVEF